MVKEYRRRWTASKAAVMVATEPSSTGCAVSVPWYRTRTRRTVRIRPAGTPSSTSSARADSSAASAARVRAVVAAASSTVSTDRCRMATTSARPIPSAESTPAIGGTSTVRMPSASATAQACWPPAPPNVTSA